MPIPTPNEDESRDEFVERCMEAIGDENEEDQALAICFDKWEERNMIDPRILKSAQILKFPQQKNHVGFTKFQAKANNAAEILIYEDIGEGWFGGMSSKTFAENLQSLGDVNQINVRINSPGGSVFDGIAIYNLLRQHEAKITTTIDGIAASIASIIFMAGDIRKSAKNGTMMVHAPWTIAAGNAEELREQAEVLEMLGDSLADTYSVRSGLGINAIKDMMAEETWLDSQQLMDNNFVSEVIEELPIAAGINFDFSSFRNCPERVINRYQEKVKKVNQMNLDARAKIAKMGKRTMR